MNWGKRNLNKIKYYLSILFVLIIVVFGRLGSYEYFKKYNDKKIENKIDIYSEIKTISNDLGYKVLSIHCKKGINYKYSKYHYDNQTICVVRTDSEELYYSYSEYIDYDNKIYLLVKWLKYFVEMMKFIVLVVKTN